MAPQDEDRFWGGISAAARRARKAAKEQARTAKQYTSTFSWEQTGRQARAIGRAPAKIARGIERAPDVVLKRLTGGGKGVLGFFKGVFRWFFTWGLVILIIVGVVVGLIFGFNAWRTGILDDFLTSAKVGVEKTPTGEAATKTGGNLLELIFKPDVYFSKTYGELDAKEEKKEIKYGVFVDNFKSVQGLYQVGDEIILLAEPVRVVSPLDKDISVSFSCNMDGRQGDVDVKNKIVPKGATELFLVSCLFNSDGIEEGVKRVELVVESTLFTDASLRLYSLNSERLNELRLQQRNPFENIDDSLLASDGIIKSTYSEGPIILAINTPYSQPLTEAISYLMIVNLRSELLSQGYIEQIEQIKLELPENIVLETSSNRCAFESASENTYTLEQEAIDKFNKNCKDIKTIGIDECIREFKEDVKYLCNFHFTSVGQGLNPEFSVVNARADYIFKKTIPTTVRIGNIEDSGGVA